MARAGLWLGGLGAASLLAMGNWFMQRDGSAGPMTRTYYIAADEVIWDYAPSGTNQMASRPFNEVEKLFMEPGDYVIGRKVKKAQYIQYTDSTFATRVERAPEWEHLGLLGPLVRAVVGDTIRIVFRNNTSFPASMHPHGVFYEKDSEGADYEDGTSGADKADDGVAPGGTHVYVWPVPDRAGPTDHEGSTAFWMYHSHTEEIRDIATGLTGPMIITRRGMARADGSPTDVDRELIAGFLEYDENHSWYVEENLRALAKKADSIVVAPMAFGALAAGPQGDKFFRETINGYSYGHTPGLTMRVGQRVRWYIMASTFFEIHAPHWHGNVVTADGMRTDVAALLPMGMVVADMVPDNPGKWFFHCHVADHLRMGMQAYYTVEPGTAVANAQHP
ncbi:MAG: multicopper oxidase domain-containing protein [Longimicrobiales bacterium]